MFAQSKRNQGKTRGRPFLGVQWKGMLEGARWSGRVTAWCHLKKLQYESWNSKRFQRECEKLQCFHLAELEERYRAEIGMRIKLLKRSNATETSIDSDGAGKNR